MKFSPAQLRAIEAKVGKPTLVLAGAGTGKTTVIANRVAHLVLEKGVRPSTIACITFTKRGAEEMASRLSAIHNRLNLVSVSTIHAMCLRILRDCVYEINIIKVYDQKSMLEKFAKEEGIRVGWKSFLTWDQFLQSEFEDWNSRIAHTLQYLKKIYGVEHLAANHTRQLIGVLRKYEKAKQELGLIDFTDMLVKVDREVLAPGQDYSSFQKSVIIIDEQQDTGRLAFRIAQKLVKKGGMYVVGDPDQRIFGFNGSDANDNIFGFSRIYEKAKTIKLQRNYRSTDVIVALGDRIIAANYHEGNAGYRKKMTWMKKNEGGEKVFYKHYLNEDEEAVAVTEQIKWLLAEGLNPEDIFIIYRTNAQSRALEDALVEEDIPYTVKNSNSFYNRKKIKDVIAYVKLAINRNDNEAFERIYNIASNDSYNYYRGLGKAFLEKCKEFDDSLWEGMLKYYDTLASGNYVRRGVQDFLVMMAMLQDCFVNPISGEKYGDNDERSSPLNLIQTIRRLCYDSYIKRSEGVSEEEGDDALRDMEQLEVAAIRFPTVKALLKHIRKMQRVHESKEDSSVVLTTIHRVKGLERQAVFGVGICEGLLPHARAAMQQSYSMTELPSPYISSVEDERCMMFVMVTRAKSLLYLSSLSNYGNKSTSPSRFLVEGEIIAKEDNNGN